jgi:hypothetical protein
VTTKQQAIKRRDLFMKHHPWSHTFLLRWTMTGEMRNIIIAGVTLALAATVLASPAARGATISTSATCSLIQAMDSANTNVAVGGCVAGTVGLDTIIVTTDVTLSAVNNGSNGLPLVTEDLVIRSPGPNVTRSITRDFTVGTPEFRILEIGTASAAPVVTITGIAMGNGRVTGPITVTGPVAGSGGCVLLRSGSLSLIDSTLEDCVARGADNAGGAGAGALGGAIYAVSGALNIRNCSFNFNTATGGAATTSGFPGGRAEGGAVQASGLASFVLESTTVYSNFATGGQGISSGGPAKGGGVVFYGLDGSMTGTTFIANAASGGAASNGTSGIGLGGAIVVEGGATLTLADSDLTDNVVSGQNSPLGLGGYAYGGAVYSSGSTLELQGSDVSNNRASGGKGSSANFDGIARGGGLYLLNTTATIDGSSVESNSISGATPVGGGIAVLHDNSTVTPLLVTHSIVSSNSANATSGSANGGALYQEGDLVTLRNTTLSDNFADNGGGLFQDNGTTVLALGSLSNNRADANGGAVAVDSGGFLGHSVNLSNTTISGNIAGLNGGGLYITGAPLSPNLTTVSLYNTTLTNNTNGGVYLAEGHSQPELISGNTIIGGQVSGADCGTSGVVILTSKGGNLESGTSCAFTAGSDQQSVTDLGLNALGNYGGETQAHDLLPDSPAVDAGRRQICNRQANGKDQRGFARFYNGDQKRGFDCDSGAVEYQGLLANPGFEAPLNAGSDWTLAASGGGDGRVRSATAPSGKFVFVFQANGALETLSQSRPLAGGSGDTYRLSLLASGAGLTPGEAMSASLRSTLGGAAVDARTCKFTFPSASFSGASPACALTTTASYDALDVVVGWDGATTGSLTLDAISLTP